MAILSVYDYFGEGELIHIDIKETLTDENAPIRHMEVLALEITDQLDDYDGDEFGFEIPSMSHQKVMEVADSLRPQWSSTFKKVYMETKLGGG